MILLVLAAAALLPPGDEASALGLRLARTSGIVIIAPMMVQKDVDDLTKEELSLSRYQRERLMQIGKEEGTKSVNRLAAALGMAYSRRLSVQDLRVLVRQNESAQAVRRRVVEPSVVAEAMTLLGLIDFKKVTATRMCKETGKLCERH